MNCCEGGEKQPGGYSHSPSGGHRLAMGAVTKADPLLEPTPEHIDDRLCFPPGSDSGLQ